MASTATVVVFSQGAPADFAAITAACPTALLCLNADVRATFHALVAADALLVARSSFSYAAALLSHGVVYSDVLRRWWHVPPSRWRLLDEAEPAALSEYLQRQDERWRADTRG